MLTYLTHKSPEETKNQKEECVICFIQFLCKDLPCDILGGHMYIQLSPKKCIN